MVEGIIITSPALRVTPAHPIVGVRLVILPRIIFIHTINKSIYIFFCRLLYFDPILVKIKVGSRKHVQCMHKMLHQIRRKLVASMYIIWTTLHIILLGFIF